MPKSSSVLSRLRRGLVATVTLVALLAGGVVSSQLTASPASALGGPGSCVRMAAPSDSTDCDGGGGGEYPYPTLAGVTAHSLSAGVYYSYQYTASGTVTETFGLPEGLTLDPSGFLSGTPAGTTGGPYSIEVYMAKGAVNGYQAFTVTVANPVSFAAPAAQSIRVGAPYSLQLAASGFPAPTFTSSTLPAGLGMTPQGYISGVPTAVGTTKVSFTAANGNQSVERTGDFSVTGTAPAFTSPAAATFIFGTPGSFTVSASGIPASTVAARGPLNLPGGVTATPGANGTIVIAGTPTQSGVATLPFRASNAVGSVDQDLVVTFSRVPQILFHPEGIAGVVGTSVTFTSRATGSPIPTQRWQRAGADGIWSDIAGATSATFTHIVLKNDIGSTYRSVFSNAGGVVTSRAALLDVQERPTISGPSSVTFVAGAYKEFTVTVGGYPIPAVQSMTTPAWLTFTNRWDGTLVFAGTAPASAVGTTGTVEFVVSNLSGSLDMSIAVPVEQAPGVTVGPESATIQPGERLTLSSIAAGVPAPTVQWQQSIDGGASFTSLAGETSPTLSITGVTAENGATYRAVYSNVHGTATTTSAVVRVGLAPFFTSPSTAEFAVDTPGSLTVRASGSPVPTLTAAGMPDGVRFHDNGDGTGVLLGSPARASAGKHVVTLTASNGFDPSSTQSLVLAVHRSPVFTSAAAQTLVQGESNSVTVSTAGGFPEATELRVVGNLPLGMRFTDNGDGTGTIAGVPAVGTGGSHTVQVEASAIGGSAIATGRDLTLTVHEKPRFASADAAAIEVGSPVDLVVATDPGFPVERAVTLAGDLPSGLVFTAQAGGAATISGTPASEAGGVYTLVLSAKSTLGLSVPATQTFTLTVNEIPTITSAATTTFAVGIAGSFSVVAAAGYPTATELSRTGSLPAGVTFVDNGDSTASIAGTPAAGTGGVYSGTISAGTVGGSRVVATQVFTLVVNELASFSTTDHATVTAGVAAAVTIGTRAGYPLARSISVDRGLPAGLSFTDNGDGTATIAGTALVSGAGFTRLVLSADNGLATAATQVFGLSVNTTPLLSSADAATFAVGTASSFTVRSSAGFPAASVLTLLGGLPDGVGFVDNGDGTATIAGTPAAGSGAAYPVTLSVLALGGTTAAHQQTFTLAVNELPAFASAASARFVLGQASSFTVSTTAGFPVTRALAASGALPAGVAFVDNGDGTASIAGTPRETGVFTLDLVAENRPGASLGQAFALTVVTPPTIVGSADAGFTIGVASSVTIESTAGFPRATVVSIEGALPAGLEFGDNGDGTATIAGTAASASAGAYPVTVTASNGVDPDTSIAGTITVVAAPVVPLPATVPTVAEPVTGVPASSMVGESIVVAGSGYAPGSTVTIGIFSTPRTLGTAIVAPDGTFSARVTLPADLVGAHTIVVSGLGADGQPRYLASAIAIAALPVASAPALPVVSAPALLASTGADAVPALWLAALLGLVGVLLRGGTRRRRSSLSSRAARS